MAIEKQSGRFENKHCEFNDCNGQCHWILLKDDGRSIYHGVFASRDEAQDMLSYANISGYNLKHMRNSRATLR